MRWRAALLVVAAAIAGVPAAGADEPGYRTLLVPPLLPGLPGPLSADGRIATYSLGEQAYVLDRTTGKATLLSRSFDGGQANDETYVDAMTPDGRWLVLGSRATNLVDRALPPDRHGERVRHLYLHDRRAGTTTLISVDPEGDPATDLSVATEISDDGRIVAFTSQDRTLDEPQPEHPLRFVWAYARDVVSGETQRVPDPAETAAGAMTPDGRYVLYIAGVLQASVHTGYQLWRWDRRTGATRQVSVVDGDDIGFWAFRGPISPDGRWVAFSAAAPEKIWVRDMRAEEARPLFLTGRPLDISADGRSLLVQKHAGSEDDRTLHWWIERVDTVTGRSSRVVSGGGRSEVIDVSRDRQHLAIYDDDAVIHDVGLQYPCDSGYRLVASDGGVFGFGNARFHGSTGSIPLNQPIVTAMPTPSNRGYWLVASDGGVFAFGDARFRGSTGGLRLASPIVDAAPTPTGNGYWLLAEDGGVFAFGDAPFLGRGTDGAASLAASPTGGGYWIVARDGRVDERGDAAPMPDEDRSTAPVVSAARTPSGAGLWLAAADGSVFTLGDARFRGSAAGAGLRASISAIAATPTGNGYRLVAADGGVFSFGDARFCGSTGAIRLNRPIVAAAG